MSNVTKEELERFQKILRDELSAFLKECPICKNKYKDYLDNKTICINCDRDQKIDNLLK